MAIGSLQGILTFTTINKMGLNVNGSTPTKYCYAREFKSWKNGAHLIKCLPQKHKDLSQIPKTKAGCYGGLITAKVELGSSQGRESLSCQPRLTGKP